MPDIWTVKITFQEVMELFILDKGRHQLSKQHLGLRVNSMTPYGKDLSFRLCLKGSNHEKIIPILYPNSAHLFLLCFKMQ